MSMSEAKKRANKKWNDKSYETKYDRILVLTSKGKKDVLKEVAASNGESVNSLINRAIDLILNDMDKKGR